MMATTPNANSPLGVGLAWTYCTCVLPFYDPTLGSVSRAVTTIQPPLGIGTNPTTGAVLPSVVAGRPLLAQAIIRRTSTPRGTLPDVYVPTTMGNYGTDVGDMAYADMTEQALGELAARIDAQVKMDERVLDSLTTTTFAGDVLLISIQVTDGAGPFRLTLGINALTSDLTVLSSPT